MFDRSKWNKWNSTDVWNFIPISKIGQICELNLRAENLKSVPRFGHPSVAETLKIKNYKKKKKETRNRNKISQNISNYCYY